MDIYDKIIEAFKKMLLLGVGFSLLAVGIAGLVLPFLPGIVLLFIGLTFCAKGSQSIAKSEYVIKSLKYLGHKFQKIKNHHAKFSDFFFRKNKVPVKRLAVKKILPGKTLLKAKMSLK